MASIGGAMDESTKANFSMDIELPRRLATSQPYLYKKK